MIKYSLVALGAFFCLVVGFLEYTGRIDILVKLGLRDMPAEGEELSVHFIDVGQGDCTLLLSDGKSMLIDSGESQYSSDDTDALNSSSGRTSSGTAVSSS